MVRVKSVFENLESLARDATSADEFSAQAIKLIGPFFAVSTMLFFLPIDEETLEFKVSYGKPYATLDEGRFLKTHRKTPVTDAIKHQRIQVWGSSSKMLREYPDLVLWPKIMPAVVAVPILENGAAVAGCVFILSEEFSGEAADEISEALGFIAHLIFEVYSRQSKKL